MEYALGNTGLWQILFQQGGVWEGPALRLARAGRAGPASTVGAEGTQASSFQLPLRQSAHPTEAPHGYFWRAFWEPGFVPAAEETALKRHEQF